MSWGISHIAKMDTVQRMLAAASATKAIAALSRQQMFAEPCLLNRARPHAVPVSPAGWQRPGVQLSRAGPAPGLGDMGCAAGRPRLWQLPCTCCLGHESLLYLRTTRRFIFFTSVTLMYSPLYLTRELHVPLSVFRQLAF